MLWNWIPSGIPTCLPISLTTSTMSSAIGLGFHFGVVTSRFVENLNTIRPVPLLFGPMYSTKNALGCVHLLLAVTLYAITSLPILHNGVLYFLPNNICLGDITGCTPDFLLNELISIVTCSTISIVSLLRNFLNGVSH